MVGAPATARLGVKWEVGIRARPVRLVTQLALQLPQIMLQIKLEIGHCGPIALATTRVAKRLVQITKGVDLWVEILVRLHTSKHRPLGGWGYAPDPAEDQKTEAQQTTSLGRRHTGTR